MRGATYMEFPAQYVNGFQSTHPVRGATTRALGVELASRISIHAPRAGCDQIIFKGMDKPAFQSTHPVRGATDELLEENNGLTNFNPRTPCGVRPEEHGFNGLHLAISIHAPRAGCDQVRAMESW